MNKTRLLILTPICVIALACTPQPATQTAPPSSANQAVVYSSPPADSAPPTTSASATAGSAAREPGDNSEADFEGTAGVVEKKRSTMKPVVVKDVRTGRHQNFDRVVFEFQGAAIPGYRVEYVKKPIEDCGEGKTIDVGGQAFLKIQITPSQTHTEQGVATITDRQRVLSLQTIKEMRLICDFEADVEWILGMNTTSKYRVLELSKPARLVIDLKHYEKVISHK